jgi:hypothetical protein
MDNVALMKIFFIVLIIGSVTVAFILLHMITYNKLFDWMGYFPSKQYFRFLCRKNAKERVMLDIPMPPDGVRDNELENLMKCGRLTEARELLQHKFEEAKSAPVGSERKLRNCAHYAALID